MKLTKMVYEYEGATLTLERVPTNAVKATWEGMQVNEGEPWSNSFDITTMEEVRLATHEILMMYYGEDPTELGQANAGAATVFAFGIKLLEVGGYS